ncbi:MAG: ATP-binding protein [Lentimicrobium sp.]|jgi:predicted AAA+ superfamily ATPase|nr:ATP-binding protein [Lentimicrobium sp.]
MINRIIEPEIAKRFFSKKAIIVTGPRQSGKTTLILKLIEPYKRETLIVNGDDPVTEQLFGRPNTEQLRQIIGKNKILFIDEAQRIPNIGLTSKLIVDNFKEVQLILSGSSSFELMNRTQEPLTGRKWTFSLWPVNWQEWQEYTGYLKAEQDLENRLIFGLYPEVLMNLSDQQAILQELTDSYLYKDILIYGNIQKPDMIQKLVQALAWQIGSEVSYAELSQMVGLDAKTVSNYIDVLEKAFILFRLPAFSRNLRNEIKTNRKIYFYDNGVRNAVVGQFLPLQSRQDTGALWENFLISERRKQIFYQRSATLQYFWRTKQQQEIDYVETRDGKVRGYEFKWNPKRSSSFPKTFTEAYDSINKGINRENFREFVMPDED